MTDREYDIIASGDTMIFGAVVASIITPAVILCVGASWMDALRGFVFMEVLMVFVLYVSAFVGGIKPYFDHRQADIEERGLQLRSGRLARLSACMIFLGEELFDVYARFGAHTIDLRLFLSQLVVILLFFAWTTLDRSEYIPSIAGIAAKVVMEEAHR